MELQFKDKTKISVIYHEKYNLELYFPNKHI